LSFEIRLLFRIAPVGAGETLPFFLLRQPLASGANRQALLRTSAVRLEDASWLPWQALLRTPAGYHSQPCEVASRLP
jgi:hypothetical protein